jgi:hypothetical protein
MVNDRDLYLLLVSWNLTKKAEPKSSISFIVKFVNWSQHKRRSDITYNNNL